MIDDSKAEKPLYSIKVKTTEENYGWAVRSGLYTEKPAGIFLILSFLLSGLASLFFPGEKEYSAAAILLTFSLLALISKFVIIPKRIRKTFEVLAANNENDNRYDLYEDHFIRINPTGTAIVKYDQISRINEDGRHICFFIPVNKVFIIDKDLCDAEVIDFIKSKADNVKVGKSRKALKRKCIVAWALGIYIILAAALSILTNKPLNDYPYSTYESFVDCLDAGFVDEVTFHKEPFRTEIITYRYVYGETQEYYNTVPPKGYDKEELLYLIADRIGQLRSTTPPYRGRSL